MGIGSRVCKGGIILGFVGGTALCAIGLPVTTGIGIGLVLGGVVLLWVESIKNGSRRSEELVHQEEAID